MMLINVGAKGIYEVGDGSAVLDVIQGIDPDVMILDWDMPGMNGREIMSLIRSPGVFPKPNLPVIVLSTPVSSHAWTPPCNWECTNSL